MTIMQNSFYGKGRRGVTLLEILVAVAVMAFALSAIFQIFPMGFSASARASYTATAYELAGKKMDELRSTRIFGGDPDPSKANTNADTYAHFGLHVNHDDATRSWRNFSGNNPASVSETSAYYFPDTNGVYKAFSTDGYDVESKYFYKVELVPQCDVVQKSGNFPVCYDGTATTATSKWLGFCDAYRVTVTVRGPVRSVAHAQDDAWSHYKKAAAEATLSTVIANKEFGVGYLAYDVVSRYVEKGDGNQNNEKLRYQGINDSRTILVTGPNGSRLYPENFTVLNPFHLTQNERWDTGPAVVVPPYTSDGRVDGYYAARSVYNYQYKVYPSGYRDVLNQVGWCGNEEPYPPTPANMSWSNPKFGTSISEASTNGDNGGAGFRHDTGRTNLSQVGSPYKDIRSKYVPGGLNYLGQDNIMLICKAKNKSNTGYSLYAESNKLIYMLPPQTTGEVVTCYGEAFKAVNNSNYWRFDLLNQIYGRDSDCVTRENGTYINVSGAATNNTNYPAYNADRLIDDQCGDTSLVTTNPNRGDLSLNDFYSASGPYSSKRPQYFDPKVGAKTATRDTSGALTVVAGSGAGTEVNCSKVYGFPRAHFSSSGGLEAGTMVRFMMKMYKKTN